jgi:hypothetical protein
MLPKIGRRSPFTACVFNQPKDRGITDRVPVSGNTVDGCQFWSAERFLAGAKTASRST